MRFKFRGLPLSCAAVARGFQGALFSIPAKKGCHHPLGRDRKQKLNLDFLG